MQQEYHVFWSFIISSFVLWSSAIAHDWSSPDPLNVNTRVAQALKKQRQKKYRLHSVTLWKIRKFKIYRWCHVWRQGKNSSNIPEKTFIGKNFLQVIPSLCHLEEIHENVFKLILFVLLVCYSFVLWRNPWNYAKWFEKSWMVLWHHLVFCDIG